jgi:hypothetical protein
VFALCAAVGAACWVAGAASLIGYGQAAATCALALVVLYPLFVAPSVERGVAATLVTAVLAVPLACHLPSPLVAFLGMSVLLAVVRSTLLYPRPFANALMLEAALAVAGLGPVLLFYDGGLVGAVFALWSFWLIQAGFALHPGESSGRDDRPIDPFEREHAAAITILEGRR